MAQKRKPKKEEVGKLPVSEEKSENVERIINTIYSNAYSPFYSDMYFKNILTNEIFDIEFKNLIHRLPRSSFSKTDTAIKNLKQAHAEGNLCLVLGAGVSFNFKIPTWESLLQRLLMKTIEKEPEKAIVLAKFFSKIFNPSPLIAGRYLQEIHTDPKQSNKFEKEVRDALYETFDEKAESPVVDEIVRFCLAPGNNPNLDSIITYNYDDIIETKILEKNMDMSFQTVYGQSIDTSRSDLKIFHVHGYLPRKENIDDQNKITLGEHVYHEQYTNIYSWNNIVQINKFRDKTCLFIGISLTDPNIRRLLDIANTQKKQRKFHYIFKKKIKKEWLKERLLKLFKDFPEDFDEKVQNNLLLDETISFLIEFNNRFEEKDSESLGVKTVWIDDYDSDISSILKRIRNHNIT